MVSPVWAFPLGEGCYGRCCLGFLVKIGNSKSVFLRGGLPPLSLGRNTSYKLGLSRPLRRFCLLPVHPRFSKSNRDQDGAGAVTSDQ